MNEQLKIIISAEIDKLKQNVDKAKSQVSSFKDQVKEASKNVDENFKNMGASMASGAKAAAVGLAAAGTALLALGASTQEYRNEQAKLTTAFEAAGSTAEQAKETYNDMFRVLGDSGQATEAASHLAKLTTEEKALAEWGTICTGVYATFGDSLPIEGLTEAANETAKTGVVTGSLADALNWAGISEDAFNEKLAATNSEAEREQLIRETLNGLYSDAAAKYEENNAQVLAQNEAQAQLQATMASLGEAVAPVITAFTSFANDALAVVVPYVQQLADTYLPALQELLNNVATALQTAFTWAVQHKELLAAIAVAIGIVTTAIGAYLAVKAVKDLMEAKEAVTVWALVKAYAAKAAAMLVAIAPYVAIVAAIAAVIAIIVLCVKHWDKIKETVKNVWASIVSATQSAVSNAKAAFDGFISKISSVVSSVKEKFSAIVSTIKDKMNAAKNTVKSIIDAIKGFFSFKFSWPKIPMPHFGISPSGWKVGDLLKGSIPKLSINWYAQGGVFDKPTLFSANGVLSGLGEAGAEAVVPLENNLGWLDKLASMLQERMGGNQPIVLEVDGRVFAQTAISTINQQTRQTGKLALNLV